MISFTAVLGIYEDTDITHDQFGWLGALFYGGFLVTQVLSVIISAYA